VVTKYFVEYEDASSQIKIQDVWRHFVLNEKCFNVNEKKGRCFLPSAQKLKVWVSSIAKQFTHGRRGKIILQGMDKNVQCFVQLIITIFRQIRQRDPKFFTDNYKTKLQWSSAL
jgi:translation initiation factor IF-3